MMWIVNEVNGSDDSYFTLAVRSLDRSTRCMASATIVIGKQQPNDLLYTYVHAVKCWNDRTMTIRKVMKGGQLLAQRFLDGKSNFFSQQRYRIYCLFFTQNKMKHYKIKRAIEVVVARQPASVPRCLLGAYISQTNNQARTSNTHHID